MTQAAAFYNEIEPVAAHVLQAVMDDGVIAPGTIDTRSIKELTAHDLAGFTQAHFFAGGGLWSVAARLAGWPDHWPLWTASCPCQPFSQAGQGGGFEDPRHLWPDLRGILLQALEGGSPPPAIIGEQVGGALGEDWFHRVGTDLGFAGYKAWVADIPAASVDAPHIRQRLYWVAVRGDMANTGLQHRRARPGKPQDGEEFADGDDLHAGADAPGVTLGDAFEPGLEGHAGHGDGARGRALQAGPVAEADGGNVGNASSHGRQQRQLAAEAARYRDQPSSAHGRNGSFWSDHEWLTCHDGKARRTKPGLRLLVDGLPGRVGLWRIAGNAIVPVLAAEVIGALKDVIGDAMAEFMKGVKP